MLRWNPDGTPHQARCRRQHRAGFPFRSVRSLNRETVLFLVNKPSSVGNDFLHQGSWKLPCVFLLHLPAQSRQPRGAGQRSTLGENTSSPRLCIHPICAEDPHGHGSAGPTLLTRTHFCEAARSLKHPLSSLVTTGKDFRLVMQRRS